MKHWDLTPGETVILTSGPISLRAGFLFRDATRADFLIELPCGECEQRTFRLRDDGRLSQQEPKYKTRGKKRMLDGWRTIAIWFITDLDRNTRHELPYVPPPPPEIHRIGRWE